jgi:phage-related protein
MAGIPKIKITFDADFDELKKGVKGAQNEVEGFGSKMGGFAKKAGKAFAIAGGAAAAYASVLLVDGVKSAIEDEAAQAKLATTLENVTGATKNQIAAVEDYITQTALANGITDDVLRPSLDRLIRSTKDVTKAQELQTLALDIAAGTGKDLKTVSEALGKAYDGNLGALKKLGVGIDDSIIKSKNFDAAAAALSKTFEGQASKQAETFQGKMARLTIAFDEAKETVGSYVLDALTPLLSGFVNKGIPAVQDFAKNLGETLGPAFGQIFKVIKEDLLPILQAWWEFLYKEVIPAIGKIVGPILEGLRAAFDKIKKAIQDNSTELEPFYGFLEKVWDFTKKYLVPLLGGAFKTALEGLGTLVAGLVTAFGKFVGLLTSIYNGAKKVIDLIKDNPITRLFGGASNASFVGVSETQGLVFGGEDGSGGIMGGGGGTFGTSAPSPTFTGAPLSAYSPAMQAAILRREELKAETARLRAQREANAETRITLNMGIVGDPEQAARTLIDVVNKSQARGTLGAGAFLTV